MVIFIDSHPTVCTFHCWFVWLDAAQAIKISILKLYESPLNWYHRVIDITSFENISESFSDPTLNLYQNLVLYRFKKYYKRNPPSVLLRWHCLQSKREVQRGVRNSKVRRQDKFRSYKLRRVRGSNNFISSGTNAFHIDSITQGSSKRQ